jgi:hypothetical protein
MLILKKGLRNDPIIRPDRERWPLATRRAFIKSMGAGAFLGAIARYQKARAIIPLGGSVSTPGFYPTGHWVPAVVPFGNSYLASTLIYPRPDTETASWAAIHWMFYDGSHSVADRTPLVLRGGAYPWVFQIITAPTAAGAALGASYWQANWTIADALAAEYGMLICTPTGTFSAGEFQIRCWAQDGTYADIEFTKSTIAGYNATSGEGIVFLDPVNGTDPGSYPSSGTINTYTTPIKTLNWAFGSAKGDVTYPNAHLKLFATGVVDTFPQNSTYGIQPVVNASPMAISSVSTQANIDAGEPSGSTLSGTFMAFDLQNGSTDHFFDNLECTGGNQSASNYWRFFSAPDGQRLIRATWNEISFPNPWIGTAPNDNAGPIVLEATTTPALHNYIAVRGCSCTNAAASSNTVALFETYNCQYGCAELLIGTNSDAPGICALKESVQDFTIQSCWADSGTNLVKGLFWDGGLGNGGVVTNNIEMRYLYAIGNGGNAWPIWLNELAGGSAATQQHWVYRCSVIGSMGLYYISGIGPLDYSVCAIQYASGFGPFMINSGGGYNSGTAIASLPSGVSYSGDQSFIGTGSIINPSTGAFEPGYTAGTVGAPIA